MEKKRVVLTNGMAGFIKQASELLYAFIIRSLFIRYIGIESLAINSTFASVISTLSLAELGVQTAVVYNLYQPLYDNDIKKINNIMNVYRIVYRSVGCFFLVSAILLLPMLKYIISGIEVDHKIQIYFLLQMSTAAFSYLLAYKRTILYADQKEFISKRIDIICNSAFSIMQMITLVLFRDYVLYLIIKILQVCISNIWIHHICNKKYTYLHKEKIDLLTMKGILSNIKDVFIGKIASYVYTATDNLVISKIIGTIAVGYYVNYTTITTGARLLVDASLNPMTPIIGNYLVGEADPIKRERVLSFYTDIRFCIALILVGPLVVLIDAFITIWLGKGFILEGNITLLLGLDLYIHIVYSAVCSFIEGLGLFKIDKYINLAAAVSNIAFSVILAKKIGIEGVLIGTLISQLFFWVARSGVVYFVGMRLGMGHYVRYWVKNILRAVYAVIALAACQKIFALLSISSPLLKFISGGILIEIISLILMFLFICTDPGHKQLLRESLLRVVRR